MAYAALAEPAAAQAPRPDASDELLPSCKFAGAMCGYVNREGVTVIAPQFDWAARFHGERARVAFAGKFGFIDRAGRVVVPLAYDMIGPLRHGVAEVLVGDKVGLVDADGFEVLAPRFGRVTVLSADRFLVAEAPFRHGADWFRFSNWFALDDIDSGLIKPTRNWGLIDRAGRWIIEPGLDEVRLFSRDEPDRFFARRGIHWRLMRTDGQPAVDAEVEGPCSPCGPIAFVKIGAKWGAIDRDGKVVVPPQFDWILAFCDDLAVVAVDGRQGAVDREGRLVVPAVFRSIGAFEKGRARATTMAGDEIWIDRTGAIIGRQQECPDGRHIERRGGGVQIVDRGGRPIGEAVFKWAHFACDAPILVETGERQWNFVDAAGHLIADRDFEVAYSFRNGIAVGYLDGRMKVIDERGAVLMDLPKQPRRISLGHEGGLDFILDHGTEREDVFVPVDARMAAQLGRDPDSLDRPLNRADCGGGVAAYWRDGKWGFEDARGVRFIPARFDAVGCFDHGMAWAAMPERKEWCMIDKRGVRVPGQPCVCEQPVLGIYPEPRLPRSGPGCYEAGMWAGRPR
jgi:hypothetical protein